MASSNLILYRQSAEPRTRTPTPRIGTAPRYSKMQMEGFVRWIDGKPELREPLKEVIAEGSNFMAELLSCQFRLEALLGSDVARFYGQHHSYLGESFSLAWDRHRKKNWLWGEYDIASFRFLAENLEQLKDARPELFEHYRRRIAKAGVGNRCHYYGPRYELFLACLFLSKGIPFEKPTSEPEGDFVLLRPGGGLVMEATTTCITKQLPGTGKFGSKVSKAIRGKAKKQVYALPSTALFIDVSQAAYHEGGIDKPMKVKLFWDQQSNARWLSPRVASSGFGSVILTHYVVLDDVPDLAPEFDFLYARYDSPHIDKRLEGFLDEYFAHATLYLPRGYRKLIPSGDA